MAKTLAQFAEYVSRNHNAIQAERYGQADAEINGNPEHFELLSGLDLYPIIRLGTKGICCCFSN